MKVPYIATEDRHTYSDYTLATYDYWVALKAGNNTDMQEAYNRPTFDGDYENLHDWVENVAPYHEMQPHRSGDIAAWESTLRFDMECDELNGMDLS